MKAETKKAEKILAQEQRRIEEQITEGTRAAAQNKIVEFKKQSITKNPKKKKVEKAKKVELWQQNDDSQSDDSPDEVAAVVLDEEESSQDDDDGGEQEESSDEEVTLKKIHSHRMVHGYMHLKVELSDAATNQELRTCFIWADFKTELLKYIKDNKLKGKHWRKPDLESIEEIVQVLDERHGGTSWSCCGTTDTDAGLQKQRHWMMDQKSSRPI